MRVAWYLGCLASAFIGVGSFVPASVAEPYAPYFGEWFLSELLQTDATPRSYLIGHRVNILDERSPLLDIVCTGNRYRLRFFPNTTVTGGTKSVITLAIDRHNVLMLEADVENVSPYLGFLRADLSVADLDRVASAQSTLVLTSPGLRNSYAFKAEQTAKAVRVLRASCQD